MYLIIKILIIICYLGGILYLVKMKQKYKNDSSKTKEEIIDYFKNSITAKMKSKLNPLTSEDKELNKLISSIRISVEHVNCQLKIFRILSERYRSRIHTFYLRFLLICSFYNFCI